MKVLITVPDLRTPGGVSSLFNTLNLDKKSEIDYFNISGNNRKKGICRLIGLIIIFFNFYKKIKKYDILHVNPSLNPKSFYRDALFIFISIFLNKRVIVYWHGWKEEFELSIKNDKIKKWIFNYSYKKANAYIVLGNVFKEKLISLNAKGIFFIESNAADDTYITEKLNNKFSFLKPKITLLFLARIEVEKGIYIAIDAFKKLMLRKDLNLQLIIAGDGSELQNVKAYVNNQNIENIIFKGFVVNEQKASVYLESDILIFPTYHEGMPLVILESMIYGLPIISRPVGGIPDWVIDGENGFLIHSLNSDDFIDPILKLIDNKNLFSSISQKNKLKAQDYFTPSKVRGRLINYYNFIYDSKRS